MSVDTTQFQSFSYIKDNGVDKYLVEEYLLPGLAVQSRLGKASRGIPLPTPFGRPQEFIKLEDAGTLVLSWLEDNHNLSAKDKGSLIKLLRKVSYEQFANVAGEVYQTRIQDPNKLFTASRLQNLAAYRAAQKSATTSPHPKFDPGKAIDDYNTLYTQLLRYANTGVSPSLFSKILPAGIPMGTGDLTKQVLAQIILQNITELRSAAHAHIGDSAAATLAVSSKLGQIIAHSYPEQAAYLNVLGDKALSENLNKFTQNIEQQLLNDKVSLIKIDELKNKALAATSDVISTEYEIYQQILKIAPITSDVGKKEFAKAIIQAINASSGRPLTSDEIITLAGQKINADLAQLQSVKAELQKAGITFAIEYRQNELSILVHSNHLTAGEKNLLKRGINPFNTHRSEADLKIENDNILREYQENTGLKFATIAEAYHHERFLNPPIDTPEVTAYWTDIHNSWTRRFRSHEDQLGTYSILEFNEKSLVNRTRIGRWVEDRRSRMYDLQSKFFDKWVDIEDTITGKKLINGWLDKWDSFAEGFTIKVGKTQIPIFRMVPWVYDRFDEWKKLTTAKALSSTSKWSSPLGKFVHWNLSQYKLGGYTVNGAVFETFRSAWGSGTKWVLEKSVGLTTTLATKMGISSAFKYATVSASRTARRLLLQIGGRALARTATKIGTEAMAALLAAGTAIGSVFSAGLAVLMVFDFLKLGFHFVKNFLTNGEFRKTVVGWGAAIWGVVTAINFGAIGIFVGAMFAGALQALMLSLVIVGIWIGSFLLIHNTYKATVQIDSGPSQIIANIVCSLAGTESPGSSSNPKLAAGKCVYEVLSGLGLNPLNKGNAVGAAVTTIANGLGNQEAAAEAVRSATDYLTFQCVGFDVVVSMMTGGSGGFSHAKLLDTIEPPGYHFVSGVGSCSPGDFFVDKNGDWGHTGLFVSLEGANIVCLDANSDGLGTVRDETTCRWPTNAIAGCLKAN